MLVRAPNYEKRWLSRPRSYSSLRSMHLCHQRPRRSLGRCRHRHRLQPEVSLPLCLSTLFLLLLLLLLLLEQRGCCRDGSRPCRKQKLLWRGRRFRCPSSSSQPASRTEKTKRKKRTTTISCRAASLRTGHCGGVGLGSCLAGASPLPVAKPLIFFAAVLPTHASLSASVCWL